MSGSRAARLAALMALSLTAISVTGISVTAISVTAISVTAISVTAMAADYPAPREGEWIAKDFKFHTGETLPELKLHYTTAGQPHGQPARGLHGTRGAAASR